MAVHYIIDKLPGKFGTMQLINAGISGDLIVYSVIDFEHPWSLKKGDKAGYKNFLSALKAILFENPRERMSKSKCEEFFNDDRNFG